MTWFQNRGRKILVGGSLVLVLFGVQQGTSRFLKELDLKETIFDSKNEEDDAGPYPLLGFLLELEDKEGVPQYPLNQVALEGCRAEVSEIKDFTPDSRDFKANSCVENDKVLYQLGRLKISDCEWTQQDKKTISMKLTDSLEKEIVLENVKVLFKDNELICSGDIVAPNNQKYPVEGNCAVAEMESFRTVNDRRSSNGGDPLFVMFDLEKDSDLLKQEQSSFQKSWTSIHLLISASIPLEKKASDYLAYMLSNEAIEACDKK